jgi:hypothetical protein
LEAKPNGKEIGSTIGLDPTINVGEVDPTIEVDWVQVVTKLRNWIQGKPWPISFGLVKNFGTKFVPCRLPCMIRRSSGWARA